MNTTKLSVCQLGAHNKPIKRKLQNVLYKPRKCTCKACTQLELEQTKFAQMMEGVIYNANTQMQAMYGNKTNGTISPILQQKEFRR